MANYHVTKDKDSGSWKVLREGAQRASQRVPLQSQAETIAKKLSHASGGGEVVIHRPSGQIRDKDTVAPGKDPNPPRDRQH